VDIDVRPVAKLRESAAAQATFGPLIQALCASPADLSRLRVVCDWIQYRHNFREPVLCRPVLAGVPGEPSGPDPAGGVGEGRLAEGDMPDPEPEAGPPPERALEVAVDLRRCADADVAALIAGALAARSGAGTGPGPVMLEPWVPGRDSCIWRFNALYWQALSHWEKATGREYEQALPGGESDARNIEAARELILELFRIWDDLDARRALPDELYVLEIGVGNGNQARTWLDAFVDLDRSHGRDYYRRLHYLMGDYSAHVLERARQAVAHHGSHVNALVLEATRPAVTLGFLAGKAFLVYMSNVYDNLPTDEVACIHGRMYRVEVRAYIGADDAERIAAQFGTGPRQLRRLVDRLLRIGPELLSESLPQHFADTGQAVSFWQAVWGALRLRERYAPLEGLDTYRISPSLTGEILRPLLEAEGDVRMHVNNGTLNSFTDTLPLLHPFGRVQCHDLFLTDRHGYRTGFYGPGKYDGSVVNWVNGPLLQLLGNRRGFDVRFSPFRQRPGANVKTLTAQVRD
jgi:hypothetical protein